MGWPCNIRDTRLALQDLLQTTVSCSLRQGVFLVAATMFALDIDESKVYSGTVKHDNTTPDNSRIKVMPLMMPRAEH